MDGRKEPKWKGVEGWYRTGDENRERTEVGRKRQEGETRKRCVMHVIRAYPQNSDDYRIRRLYAVKSPYVT